MSTLVLLRHGESEWNKKNLFTGWVDVDLTDLGEEQARLGGLELKKAGVLPTVVHTSLLTRAIRTANIALEACERNWLPVTRHWRLNERHYGDLQGKDKKAVRDKYGEEQFMEWRRSYDVRPPSSRATTPSTSAPTSATPPSPATWCRSTECLKDVVHRLLPYWYDSIVPDLRSGETVLVAAHGNSLRALVMHLDGLSEEQVVGLNIPTGQPLRYDLDDDLRRRSPAGPTSTRRPLRRPQPRWRRRATRWPGPAAAGRTTSSPTGGRAPRGRSRSSRRAEPVSAFPPGTWRKVLVGGLLGAVALSSLAWFVLDRQRDQRRLATALVAGSCEADRRADPVAQDRHVARPVFRVDPPAGGTHTEDVARAGTYAGDDLPDDGPLVHALEHGYVVLWHRPGVPTAPLERVAADHEGDVLVVERASLPVPVAATAWGRRLLCGQTEPAVLGLFVDAYVGQGPEDVRRG